VFRSILCSTFRIHFEAQSPNKFAVVTSRWNGNHSRRHFNNLHSYGKFLHEQGSFGFTQSPAYSHCVCLTIRLAGGSLALHEALEDIESRLRYSGYRSL
jgi:hypothetical protein